MASALKAWMLEWAPQPIALAQCEVVEIVEEPEIHRVPIGPAWCRALLYWRQQFLPLAISDDVPLDRVAIVVVAYQQEPRTPLQYAALAVRGMPIQFEVPTQADCLPPHECIFTLDQMRACFRLEDKLVVVPELSRLFGTRESAK